MAANPIASLQATIEKELAMLREEAPPPASSRISIPQGTKTFKFPEGNQSPDPFSAIILDSRRVNTYYETMFNPNDRKPPACWAIGSGLRSMVPQGAKKQCENCVNCPMNQFGSKGKGKACKNTVRLALVPVGATLETTPWTLTVSPTGLKAYDAYINSLTSTHGKIPLQVITEVSFDPKQAYATLLFKLKGLNDDLETALALREGCQAALDKGFSDEPF